MGFHPYGLIGILGIILTVYSGLDYKRSVKNRLDLVGIFFISASWFLFVSAFVMDDFNLVQVYSYSTKDMPLWLKISSSWAGMAGSFILWALMMAVISFFYKLYGIRRNVFEETAYRGLLLITASVMVLSIEVGAFETADVNFRIPAGASLNPLLRSFWILIHPLFTFGGYAFSLALALHVLLSKRKDFFLENILAGLAWINLSIGIIAGGVWAYNVLGWGGYWAWDPVETAELVPWLALTAFFHSRLIQGEGAKRLSAALAGFFTFYSSFMTKAGASFTASVHTFEWTPKATLLVVLHFVFGLSILALYAWKPGSIRISVSMNNSYRLAFLFAWVSLIALSLVTFFGIFTPVIYAIVTGGLISVGMDYYNYYSSPFVLLFLASLVGCSLRNRISTRTFIYFIALIYGLGMIFGFYKWPFELRLADFLLPAIIVAVPFTLFRLLSDAFSRRPRFFGLGIIHFAVPLLLLGVVLNVSLDSSVVVELQQNESVDTPYGITLVYTGYEVRASDWEIFYKGHLIPEGAYGDFIALAYDGNEKYELVLPVRVPFAYGCGSEPKMISKGLHDIYVSIVHADFHNRLRNIILERTFYGNKTADADYIVVEVKYNPFIDLVWWGSALLVLGGIVTVSTIIVKERVSGGVRLV